MRRDKGGAFFGQAGFFADHCTSRSSIASLQIFGDGYCSQDPNNGHHDHQFDQGEGVLLLPPTAEAFKKNQLGTGLHGSEN